MSADSAAKRAVLTFEGQGWIGRLELESASEFDVADLVRRIRPVLDHLVNLNDCRQLTADEERLNAGQVSLPFSRDRSELAVDTILNQLNMEIVRATWPRKLIVPLLWGQGVRDPELMFLVMERLADRIPDMKTIPDLQDQIAQMIDLFNR